MSAVRRMKRKKVLQVLDELSIGDAVGIDTISQASKLDRKEARRIVRHLARKKLVEFARGYLITDEGKKRLKNDQQPE